MKAVVVEQPGQLQVREIPEPTPGDYDALCRIEYGAVCTGTDQHLISATFPWPVQYPTILGHESIGARDPDRAARAPFERRRRSDARGRAAFS
jgi:D-arabinose 1-dehydrogenase-like Zn-dependent alcohol dehydrogenase